ncbi:MAG: hypothetical protein M5U12_06580 [Verrucomicrobia bacterium]|nr:hypothetical protein [Verrucomicrobiota bacterium]
MRHQANLRIQIVPLRTQEELPLSGSTETKYAVLTQYLDGGVIHTDNNNGHGYTAVQAGQVARRTICEPVNQ